MTTRKLSVRISLAVLTQLLHFALLLLPTLILAGTNSIDLSIVLFASCLVLASVCEAGCVTQPTVASDQSICDKKALRVAAAVGLILLMTFWSAQIEHHLAKDTSIQLQCIGLACVTFGLLLRVLAIRELGPRFVSDVQASGKIVESGIYRWFRHPSEIGLLLIACGAPLVLSAVVSSMGGLLVLLPVSVWRMRRENAALYASMASGEL